MTKEKKPLPPFVLPPIYPWPPYGQVSPSPLQGQRYPLPSPQDIEPPKLGHREKKPLPPEQPFPWPHGEAMQAPPAKCDHQWGPWPEGRHVVPSSRPDKLWEMCGKCRAPRVRPHPDAGEQWMRYDSVTIKLDELDDMLDDHNRALSEVFRRFEPSDLCDPIPPGGRSTPGRSAANRECSDTCDYHMPDPPTLQDVYGSTPEASSDMPQAISNTQNLLEDAGEDDVVIVIDHNEYTKREFVLEVARARKRLGQRPPKCEHKPISPRDGLCLNCGEMVRQS